MAQKRTAKPVNSIHWPASPTVTSLGTMHVAAAIAVAIDVALTVPMVADFAPVLSKSCA